MWTLLKYVQVKAKCTALKTVSLLYISIYAGSVVTESVFFISEMCLVALFTALTNNPGVVDYVKTDQRLHNTNLLSDKLTWTSATRLDDSSWYDSSWCDSSWCETKILELGNKAHNFSPVTAWYAPGTRLVLNLCAWERVMSYCNPARSVHFWGSDLFCGISDWQKVRSYLLGLFCIVIRLYLDHGWSAISHLLCFWLICIKLCPVYTAIQVLNELCIFLI